MNPVKRTLIGIGIDLVVPSVTLLLVMVAFRFPIFVLCVIIFRVFDFKVRLWFTRQTTVELFLQLRINSFEFFSEFFNVCDQGFPDRRRSLTHRNSEQVQRRIGLIEVELVNIADSNTALARTGSFDLKYATFQPKVLG